MAADPLGHLPVVRAAGGVVLRGDGATVEVLVVHRPRYDDWSLPKGKVDPGESDPDAARREVEEETGYSCELGAELAPVEYVDHHGRPKVVRYWLMAVVDGWFRPNDEVDEARWLTVEQAADLLTYPHDQRLLQRATAARPDLRGCGP